MEVAAVLTAIEGEMTGQTLQQVLGLKNADYFRKAYLLPAIAAGCLEMTYLLPAIAAGCLEMTLTNQPTAALPLDTPWPTNTPCDRKPAVSKYSAVDQAFLRQLAAPG